MPQQPTRLPTPLDLARVRPRPAQPPPPRNRRQAEMEKDRARQELRTLPAAGFAALPGDEFFAALKQACQDGTANLALIADCERRIKSREVGPRELHQMLFAASDRHAWAGVRTLALAAAGQVPGTAVAVVGLEAQRLGVALMQVTESAADGGFTATASLERDGARRGQGGLRRQQEDRAAGPGAVAAGRAHRAGGASARHPAPRPPRLPGRSGAAPRGPGILARLRGRQGVA